MRTVHPDVARTAEAVANLFHPHVEVALHDLVTRRIVQLWNPVPGRRAGDRSALAPEFGVDPVSEQVIGPFAFVDAAGRRITSVSVPVEEGTRLLCFNFDRTAIEGALGVLASLASVATVTLDPDVDSASTDWQARIKSAITTWCLARNLTPKHLTKDLRLQVVQQLQNDGLFQTRNAAEHVAAVLGVSRATIYNLRAQATPIAVPCSPGQH